MHQFLLPDPGLVVLLPLLTLYAPNETLLVCLAEMGFTLPDIFCGLRDWIFDSPLLAVCFINTQLSQVS